MRWARANDAVILFDAAYEGYIRDPALPHSIYEIPGAREVAIEFRSYSKLAGFTGLRCGYVVVPKELVGKDAKGNPVELHRLWLRRQSTKFNGASFPIQVGAAACYTEEGRRETRASIDYYMENARIIRAAMTRRGPARVRRRERAVRAGSRHRRASARGSSSTGCSTRRTSSARRARASAPAARATCACPRSASARTSKRRSRACAKTLAG